jgi:DNA-binding cell septation regulator SpoVG
VVVGKLKGFFMIGVLNFKPFQRGSIVGFFDLRYHGLTIKGCRLMTGSNGHWMAFPQKEGHDKEDKAQYFDQMYLTKPEAEHVRRLVVAELEAQGAFEYAKPAGRPKPSLQPSNGFRHPDTGEDLSDCMPPADDGLPY